PGNGPGRLQAAGGARIWPAQPGAGALGACPAAPRPRRRHPRAAGGPGRPRAGGAAAPRRARSARSFGDCLQGRIMSWVTELARPEIVALKAYEHAAWEPRLERLHANELPWRAQGDESLAGLNRYPEPQPRALIERLAALYGAAPESILAR